MEDTLRVDEKTGKEKKTPVLILVLMEDTLRATGDYTATFDISVLILVLMEDTLRDPMSMKTYSLG